MGDMIRARDLEPLSTASWKPDDAYGIRLNELLTIVQRLEAQYEAAPVVQATDSVRVKVSAEKAASDARWPTDEEQPATCPNCGISWESTDLRRHPTKLLPWWRCSDCSAEWNEVERKAVSDA